MKWRGMLYSAALLYVALPTFVFAQTPLVPCSGIACTPCDLYTLIQNIINFLIELSIPIAVFLMAYAGVLLFTANANPGKITQARRIFTSAMVGLAIALSGWLLVQVIINTLVSKQFQSRWSWNKIECQGVDRLGVNQSVSVSDWLNGTIGQGTTVPISVSSTTLPGGPSSTRGDQTCTLSPIGTVGCGKGFTTISITNQLFTEWSGHNINQQLTQASPGLASLVSCIQSNYQGGLISINAITSSGVGGGQCTIDQCKKDAGGPCGNTTCGHTPGIVNDCHFGGDCPNNGSDAIDLQALNSSDYATLESVVQGCDPNAWINYEGSHIHVSVGAQNECSCDTSLQNNLAP